MAFTNDRSVTYVLLIKKILMTMPDLNIEDDDNDDAALNKTVNKLIIKFYYISTHSLRVQFSLIKLFAHTELTAYNDNLLTLRLGL